MDIFFTIFNLENNQLIRQQGKDSVIQFQSQDGVQIIYNQRDQILRQLTL